MCSKNCCVREADVPRTSSVVVLAESQDPLTRVDVSGAREVTAPSSNVHFNVHLE